MSTPVYKVIAETTEQVQCDVCGGVGHTIKTFQREKYKSPCFMCGGTGTRKKIHKTDVTLQEALRNIGMMKDEHQNNQ